MQIHVLGRCTWFDLQKLRKSWDNCFLELTTTVCKNVYINYIVPIATHFSSRNLSSPRHFLREDFTKFTNDLWSSNQPNNEIENWEKLTLRKGLNQFLLFTAKYGATMERVFVSRVLSVYMYVYILVLTRDLFSWSHLSCSHKKHFSVRIMVSSFYLSLLKHFLPFIVLLLHGRNVGYEPKFREKKASTLIRNSCYVFILDIVA